MKDERIRIRNKTAKVDLPQWDLDAAVVPFILRDGKRIAFEGTAFCIANMTSGESIFVTARHVVDVLHKSPDRLEPFLLLPRSSDVPANRPRNLTGIPVIHLSISQSHSDVAILIVDTSKSKLPVTENLRRFPMTLDSPIEGEKCLALGYPQAGVKKGSAELLASEGVIEEVFPSRIDSVLAPFPSFQTTAPYIQGMSGGPIINMVGQVIGVVSTGAQTSDPGQEWSRGALLGGLAELEFDLKRDDGTKDVTTIATLVQWGVLRNDFRPMKFTRNNEGVELSWDKD